MKISDSLGRALAGAAMLLVLASLLAACGGAPEKEEPKPVAEAPAPAPQPAPKTEPEPEKDSPVSVQPAQAVPSPEPRKLEPVAEQEPEAPMAVPERKGPNHHVITVAEKKPGHPAYGKGHKKGFYIDGASQPVVIKRGQTYEFEVKTDPLHDVYFSSSAQGWGGAPIVEGITGQFTYDGIITVKPDQKTPDVIYYSCRNHNSMGWKVLVVDANTSDAQISKMLEAEKQVLAKLASEAAGKAAAAGNQKGKQARQKLSLAGMMLSGSASKRVMAGDSDEAKTMLGYAKNKIEEGNKALEAGDGAKAFDLAGQALNMISTAQRLVPTDEELKVQAEEYKGMLITVEHFEISHKEQYDDTVKRRGKKEAVDYDRARVKALIQEAKDLAAKKKYLNATARLSSAEREITAAIQKMMDKQVVEYTLDFATPKDEWEYELKRYKGYEDLVPVAVEQKKPNDNLKKLMDMYIKKGQEQRDAAVATAAKGDYPLAIAMILSATEQIRRGLKTVGVSQ